MTRRTMQLKTPVVLISIGVIILSAYLMQKFVVIRTVCMDCATGYIGGGCTYVDAGGKTIQPKKCVPYDETKIKHSCPQRSREGGVCIELYEPVCGNDARTYSNSCFACLNPHVAFYIEGSCDEAIKK